MKELSEQALWYMRAYRTERDDYMRRANAAVTEPWKASTFRDSATLYNTVLLNMLRRYHEAGYNVLVF